MAFITVDRFEKPIREGATIVFIPREPVRARVKAFSDIVAGPHAQRKMLLEVDVNLPAGNALMSDAFVVEDPKEKGADAGNP